MAERVYTLSDLHAVLSPPPDIPIRLAIQMPVDGLPGVSSSTVDESVVAPSQPDGRWYALALRAARLLATDPGDALLAPVLLADRLIPHAYQLRVVREVLREKRPTAILADEVGLGKTIEAGLILKELFLRGVARRALVVAPRALLTQWQEALRDLFDEEFLLSDDKAFRGFAAEDRLICSYGQLVSAVEQISARTWDCLIADEAHLLANPDSRRRRSVAAVPSRWRLLLTATPIQNRVTDLYSLIDLAVPGRLGTPRQFINTYVADGATAREVLPGKLEELRAVARETMCRTRRADTDVAFVSRRVDTVLVTPQADETALYRDVTTYLRKLYRRAVDVAPAPASGGNSPRATRAKVAHANVAVRPAGDGERQHTTSRLNRGSVMREIVALQQSLSSSPPALAAALRARADRHAAERAPLLALASRADTVVGGKESMLVEALSTLPSESVLIFTLRLETARHLRALLEASGRSADCYTGALAPDERRSLVARFSKGDLHTLIATDAGAEGLNLHDRCHIVFNYDLHWNPMKMEQRIGRVHRLGQRHEVRVANFAVGGTIDEYVLQLLHDKMQLFTSAIGEIDSVLADLNEGELDIEERLLDLWLRTDEDSERQTEFARVAAEIAEARAALDGAADRTTEVLG